MAGGYFTISKKQRAKLHTVHGFTVLCLNMSPVSPVLINYICASDRNSQITEHMIQQHFINFMIFILSL